MRRFAARLGQLLLVLLVVTFLVSAMIELMPGDPAVGVLGDTATQEQIDAFHQRFHLEDPVYTRYVHWLGDFVHGDLGESFRTGVPMTHAIRERIPVTLELLIGGQIIALLFAVPAGIYAAYRPRRFADQATGAVSFGLISAPSFVLAMFFVIIFAVKLDWFPVAGYTSLSADVGKNLKSMIMPMVVVAAPPAAFYQRLIRNDMRATLQEDFILMAEAKGQSTWRVLFRHALRPSTVSLITLIGVMTAQALAGSVIVEYIFALPGIGRLLFDSITIRDLPAIQAVVAVISIVYVLLNALVDMLYGVIDPRVRHDRR
jgi:peptide/nickel transport system permease protein